MKKLLIGGKALIKMGSDRTTSDTDYLIFDESTPLAFIHDVENDIDYVNANGHKFFAAIWEMEKENNSEIASPQAILELKAFSFVQNCLNGHWKKADAAEYDIKFLVRTFDLEGIKISKKFLSKGEVYEIEKIIKSVKK